MLILSSFVKMYLDLYNRVSYYIFILLSIKYNCISIYKFVTLNIYIHTILHDTIASLF